MATKVELDLLELDDLEDAAEEGAAAEPKKRRISLKWISISVFLLLSVTGTSVWIYLKIQNAGVSKEKVSVVLEAANIERFDDFVISMKDDHGNYRVLICDIALELSKDAKISESRVNIRRTIYKAAKKKRIDQVMTHNFRKTLKKAIKFELNNYLGEKIIKQVYFTRFVLM